MGNNRVVGAYLLMRNNCMTRVETRERYGVIMHGRS
jgi:hypothetical protein